MQQKCSPVSSVLKIYVLMGESSQIAFGSHFFWVPCVTFIEDECARLYCVYSSQAQ